MTITATTTRGSFVPTISVGEAIPIPFMSETDIVVHEVNDTTFVATLLTAGVEYDFTLTGTAPSVGELVPNTVTAGTTWYWRRDTTLDQQLSLSALGTFPVGTVERAFDKQLLALQEADDQVARSVGPPEQDPADLTLPGHLIRANKAFHFDSAGLPAMIEPADASGTSVLPTGGSQVTSRVLAERFGEVFNVKDYGATGDGATDDTAAINLAFDALRAQIQLIGTEETYLGTVLFPPGQYNVTTIDATGIWGGAWGIEGSGAQLECDTSQVHAVLDLTGSRFGHIRNVTIIGESGTSPAWGIGIARETFHTVSDLFLFENVSCFGYFTKGCLYNFSCESTTFLKCNFWNRDVTAGSYCMVLDGLNQVKFGFESNYIATEFAQPTPASFIGNTFIDCDARKMVGGPVVYMMNTSGHRWLNCFASSIDDACIVIEGNVSGHSSLDMAIHCETAGATSSIEFRAILPSTGVVMRGFAYCDNYPLSSTTVFDTDASITGTGGVELRDYDIKISYATNGIFANPTDFALYGGKIHVGQDGGSIHEAVHREHGIANTGDRDLDAWSLGSQLVFDRENDDLAIKGRLSVYDTTASVAAGALGDLGEVYLSEGCIAFKKSGFVLTSNEPTGEAGYITLWSDDAGVIYRKDGTGTSVIVGTQL